MIIMFIELLLLIAVPGQGTSSVFHTSDSTVWVQKAIAASMLAINPASGLALRKALDVLSFFWPIKTKSSLSCHLREW